MHTADGCWAAFHCQTGLLKYQHQHIGKDAPTSQKKLCLLSPAGALHCSSSLTSRGQLVRFALPTRHRAPCLCRPWHRFAGAAFSRSPICRECLQQASGGRHCAWHSFTRGLTTEFKPQRIRLGYCEAVLCVRSC